MLLDVRRQDEEASLASVAQEVEMEEEGDGAKLFRSKVETRKTCHDLAPRGLWFPKHWCPSLSATCVLERA